ARARDQAGHARCSGHRSVRGAVHAVPRRGRARTDRDRDRMCRALYRGPRARHRHVARRLPRASSRATSVAHAHRPWPRDPRHAEQTLAGMGTEEQRLCREAFRHLVTGAGTRAVLTRTELLEVLGNHALAGMVIDRLVGARLVVASEAEGGEDRVEIIHETL